MRLFMVSPERLRRKHRFLQWESVLPMKVLFVFVIAEILLFKSIKRIGGGCGLDGYPLYYYANPLLKAIIEMTKATRLTIPENTEDK